MSYLQLRNKWSTLGYALLTLGLITGCADHASERSGSQLDVVPVSYSVGIKIKPGHQIKANEKLDEFTDKYWRIIAQQGATITWRTNSGKTLGQNYYTQLASRGVSISDLTLTKLNTEQNDNTETQKVNPEYFDLEVKTTVHKIISDVCQYPKVGHYDELNDGCAMQSNRWKSMVHPEKMLDKPLKNTL